MKKVMSLLQVITLLCLLVFPTAQAAEIQKYAAGVPQIPTTPSAPPAIHVGQPKDTFSCSREFLFNGQRFNCDSLIRQDGERLRPIIKNVPEAIAELDLYQKNRRAVRAAAYIGTMGILIAVAGSLLSSTYKNKNGDLTTAGKRLYNFSWYGGWGLTGATLIYGISALNANEAHLGNAVRLYNENRPDLPIQLQFTTEFDL